MQRAECAGKVNEVGVEIRCVASNYYERAVYSEELLPRVISDPRDFSSIAARVRARARAQEKIFFIGGKMNFALTNDR